MLFTFSILSRLNSSMPNFVLLFDSLNNALTATGGPSTLSENRDVTLAL